MKPKLWDGPNAVGEARMRGLEQVATPYISASGPGFTASKKGQFSEVTGSQQEAVTFEETNWWSTSDNGQAEVVITGSNDYKRKFTFRGRSYNDLASGVAGNGTILVADGRGAAFRSLAGGGPTDRDFTYFGAERTFNGGRHVSFCFTHRFFRRMPPSIARVSFYSGSGTHYLNDEQGPYAVGTACDKYIGEFDWPRSKAVLHIAAKGGAGAWGTATIDLPQGGTDPEDAFPPTLAIHGLTRLSIVHQHNVLGVPKLMVSDDLGQSWSSGIDISGLWGGVDPWLNNQGFDMHPLYGQPESSSSNPHGAPHTEEWWNDRVAHYGDAPTNQYWPGLEGAYPEDQRRLEYILNLPSEPFKRGGVGGLNMYAVSNRLVVIATDATYYDIANDADTPRAAIAVFDVNGGMVNRTEFVGFYPRGVYLLGHGTWLFKLADESGGYFKITKDFGQTYEPFLVLETTQSFFPIAPYTPDPNGNYLIGGVYDDDNGAKRIFTIDDLDSYYYTYRGVLGTAEMAGRPLSFYDFTVAVNTGTRAKPGPIDPCYPWTRDYRYDVPAWWNE